MKDSSSRNECVQSWCCVETNLRTNKREVVLTAFKTNMVMQILDASPPIILYHNYAYYEGVLASSFVLFLFRLWSVRSLKSLSERERESCFLNNISQRDLMLPSVILCSRLWASVLASDVRKKKELHLLRNDDETIDESLQCLHSLNVLTEDGFLGDIIGLTDCCFTVCWSRSVPYVVLTFFFSCDVSCQEILK